MSRAILLFLSTVALLTFATTPQSFSKSDEQTMVDAARAMTKKLGKELKGQLKAALKAGGPMNALNVCKLVAPKISKRLSEEGNGTVGRTALRVRNPENAADDFEKTTLLEFVRAAEAGEDVTKLERSEIVNNNGKRVFRYMKAIPMAEKPCAACHGSSIKQGVREKIDELYPNDQAVNFKPGDIRGAFTITKDMQ